MRHALRSAYADDTDNTNDTIDKPMPMMLIVVSKKETNGAAAAAALSPLLAWFPRFFGIDLGLTRLQVSVAAVIVTLATVHSGNRPRDSQGGSGMNTQAIGRYVAF